MLADLLQGKRLVIVVNLMVVAKIQGIQASRPETVSVVAAALVADGIRQDRPQQIQRPAAVAQEASQERAVRACLEMASPAGLVRSLSERNAEAEPMSLDPDLGAGRQQHVVGLGGPGQAEGLHAGLHAPHYSTSTFTSVKSTVNKVEKGPKKEMNRNAKTRKNQKQDT